MATTTGVTAMKRSRALRPTLADRLEDRLVMSHGAIHHAALVGHHGHLASPAVSIVLVGTVEGTTFPPYGSGTVSPLGLVSSDGTLENRAGSNRFHGFVTLRRADGTITTRVTALKVSNVNLVVTCEMTYTIQGGTGAFSGATGSSQGTYIYRTTGDFWRLQFGHHPGRRA
jgi:hypothetical protein